MHDDVLHAALGVGGKFPPHLVDVTADRARRRPLGTGKVGEVNEESDGDIECRRIAFGIRQRGVQRSEPLLELVGLAQRPILRRVPGVGVPGHQRQHARPLPGDQ